VCLTFDVEVGHGHDPQCRLWGRISGREHGVRYQANALKRYGWRGSFFVNAFESRSHGAALFQEVTFAVIEAGSQVELHTHPDGWTGDRARRYMWQYSSSEQRDLVRTGVELLSEWTGVSPIAHRAGSLAADEATLAACAAAGLKVDSSYAYGWTQCRLRRPFGWRNALLPSTAGVVEVPVSTFQDLPPLRHVRHVDINAATTAELDHVLGQVARDPAAVLVVLMHSFSFVERTGHGYVERAADRARFEWLLDRVGQLPVDVVTMADLAAAPAVGSVAPVNPVALRTGPVLTYARSVQQARRSRKALAVALGVPALAGAATGLLAWWALA
jgi:peptidoglycan/xylan/chitin deacetylase (PgdA/CDA1 family)